MRIYTENIDDKDSMGNGESNTQADRQDRKLTGRESGKQVDRHENKTVRREAIQTEWQDSRQENRQKTY